MLRIEQAERLLEILRSATCCSLYGLSNAGKSQLLRALPAYARDRQPTEAMLLVYVDCNRIVENNAHGFFDDSGALSLMLAALALVAVILVARQMRTTGA